MRIVILAGDAVVLILGLAACFWSIIVLSALMGA